MQCPTCSVVYSNGLDNCPRCKTPAPQTSALEEIQYAETSKAANNGAAAVETENVRMTDKQPETKSQSSTLIEFPGKKRQEMPAWRKELLEKFKEIQDKRAREAEEEAEVKTVSEETVAETVVPTEEVAKPHLEVVPPAPVNPIVAKALERIERANHKPHNSPANINPKTNRAAVVNGNLSSEQEEKEQKFSLIQPQQKVKAMGMSAAASSATQIHSHTNGAAAAKIHAAAKQLPDEDNYNISRNGTASIAHAVAEISSIPATQSFSNGQLSKASSAAGIETIKTEKMPEVLKEVSIEEPDVSETFSEPSTKLIENESFTEDDDLHYDDYAPYMPRMVSVVFDTLAIVFAASPFAAVMELSDVDWTNDKIVISLGAILLLVAFFYLMASVAILGRTWGMATLSLRVADAETGESPSVGQSTGRAFLFLLSVAAAFLPFLYTLFDAEGRALHDRISGTIIVREE